MSLDSRIRDNFERIEELPEHEKTIVGYDAFMDQEIHPCNVHLAIVCVASGF